MTNLSDLQVVGTIEAANLISPVQGNTTGSHTGLVYGPAPLTYDGGVSGKAVSPNIGSASLTKGSAGTDYTLAAPGAANVGKYLSIYTTGAYAHVITVTGLLGGNTLTFTAAIGNGFTVFAASATVWVLIANNGVTQSQVG